MPRYLVERTFADGLRMSSDAKGANTCMSVVKGNADYGVTWIHSYVREDDLKTYCIYDGPDPESIRQASEATGLPIDRITRVNVLDPYFNH
jgi:hypothetical protein